MKLEGLNGYDEITIQCHDNPDADTIASGYGLYCYFKSKNKKVRLVYSGGSTIRKSNLKLMLEKLSIPIEYISVDEAKDYLAKGLLITVDCQYGAGNVTRLMAENVAIIDHHQPEVEKNSMVHILPDVGSCSTVVWMLLKEAGYMVDDTNYLSTALYYGLFSDTNSFQEIKNPFDRDAQDSLFYDAALIDLFSHSNISLNELEIAGVAMLRYVYNEEYHFAVVKTKPCDANILGLISDFLLQVDEVYCCVVYNEVQGGYKISVRSCVREINAGELASYLAGDMGSGGGRFRKAGGTISQKLYSEKMGNTNSEAYFIQRLIDYYTSFDNIYANDYEADISQMEKYRKKEIMIGYVEAKDVLPLGTPITIRTLEGDQDVTVEEDLIIMIGVDGEVYPNHRDKFRRRYRVVEGRFSEEMCGLDLAYEPMIISRNDGSKKPLEKYAGLCVATGEVFLYAKELTKDTKVFTDWDKEKYMSGKVGDYLVVRCDDLHDVYVVQREIFKKTYEKV